MVGFHVIGKVYSFTNRLSRRNNTLPQMTPGHKVDMYPTGIPDSKVRGANMGPTWVQSAPDGPHVGPINLAIWVWQ